MSVISNVHSFVKLDKDAKPAMGQRLVRLIAKGAQKHANLSESLAVSVPRVTQDQVAEVIDRLLPHVVGLVQDTQDKIIRDWRIEYGREAIPESEFSVSECIAYLDATAAGDRVSAEYLQEWFADEYRITALSYISNAMSIDWSPASGEIPTVLEQKYAILRDMFAGWASPKYSPAIPKLKAMIKFGEVIGEVDSRMSAMLTKAKVMLQRKEEELAEDALGF